MFEKYDAYKDSGVDWIGDIPAKWSLKKISHVFRNIGSGTTPLSGSDIYYKNGSINWLQTGDLNDGYIDETSKKITEKALRHYSTLKQYQKGSLVVAMYGATIGKVGILNIDTATNQACCVLGANLGVDIKYYFYMLQGFKADIIRMAYGGGQPNISQDTIKNLRLPFPDLSTQHEISKFLDQKTSEIDQAIAIKEKQIALLNERKQIVIQKAVTQGLDPNVPMKESGVEWICQIPEHWECKPSRYAFRATKRFKRDGTEIKFSVTQKWGVIPTDEMQESATQAVSFDGFQICLEDDLVLNKYKAHLGVFWRAPSRGLITGNYTVFEPLKGINSKYFELLYHTPVYIDIFRTIVYGVIEGMMPLYNNDFYDMLSIVPPLEEQLAIVQYVGEQQKEFSKIERVFLGQIEKLKEYKTTLINDAVTGKIKVA